MLVRRAILLLIAAILIVATGVFLSLTENVTTPAPGFEEERSRGGTQDPQPDRLYYRTNKFSGIQDIVEALRHSNSPGASRATVDELRAWLDGLPPEETVQQIRQSLDSGSDSPTQLGFVLQRNGFLKEAPSFRTLMLDELGRRDPGTAATYAESILLHLTNPEEWALALRNLARGGPDERRRAVLLEKTRQLLLHEPWHQAPAVAYLEAFDVAVHLGGDLLVSELSGLIRKKDNQALSHAAFLALDRIVISEPAAALSRFQSEPELLRGRESTRANYFARADVGHPDQRTALAAYLLDPARSSAELETFTGVYPNANYMISPNLLTTVTTPDRAALIARDRAALVVINEWLAEPRFEQVKPYLRRMQSRVERFVRQAGDREE